MDRGRVRIKRKKNEKRTQLASWRDVEGYEQRVKERSGERSIKIATEDLLAR